MTDTRFFSSSQRKELFLRANKKCQMCREPISLDNFHADHITPHSKGGPTNLANGQALCPSCNYNKASAMTVNYEQFVPVGMPIRAWQDDFLKRCYGSMVRQISLPPSQIKAFILMAFPGAGKTLAQVLIAQVLLEQKFIDKVIFCVPSDPLRKQMVDDAIKSGLKLTRSKSYNHHGYDGIVTTYQSIAHFDSSCKKFVNAEVLRSICEDKKVLVIADECHHLAGGNNWGDGFEIAFSNSVARLMTSGTPFRTDGKAIPWLRYHEKSIDLAPPHAYAYDYGFCKWNQSHCALGDKVVRDVVIHAKDIELTFEVGTKKNGIAESKLYTHRLSDNIDAIPEYQCVFSEDGKRVVDNRQLRSQIRSRRREACLECGSDDFPYGTEYVREVLREANKQLTLVREGHPWASGLIICQHKEHADHVEKALLHWTGEAALVVYSGKGNESELIKNFKNNKTRSRLKWIIAVGMISEGVNIPHLRVGVYMTHIQAAMKWTQILGRILRKEDGISYDKQTAHFFQYDDGVVLGVNEEGSECNESTGIKLYAETLLKEREAYLKTTKQINRISGNEGNNGNLTTVKAISTSDLKSDQIYGGERFDQMKVKRFERIAARTGLAAAKLAYLVEVGGQEDWLMALNN